MSDDLRALEESRLKPYISFTVFSQSADGGSADDVCNAICKWIETDKRSELIANGLNQAERDAAGEAEEDADRATLELCVAYRTKNDPSWGGLPSSGDKSEEAEFSLHLAVVFEAEPLVAFHTTDGRLREHLLRLQRSNELEGVELVERSALERALLQGEIATLWMGQGAAGRGRPGPRSKTHHGDNLGDSIDPVADQSHTLSGARAAAGEDLLGGSREGVIGANLDQSRFWLRRAKNWTEFVQITSRILAAINNASDGAGGDERLSVFARYIDDLEPVARPYDLSFDAPWEESGKIPTQSEIDAFDWLSQHVVFIEPEDEQSARVRVTDGNAECTMVLKPEQRKKSVTIRGVRDTGSTETSTRFCAELKEATPMLFYESGHSVSKRGIVAEQFADVPFSSWRFVSLNGVDISAEKPGDGKRSTIKKLGGKDNDTSLFGWIIRNHRSGWLYCDDGSDELFDFVHLDPAAERLSIWHVKACKSGSQRSIAAVPYEHVCAQMQKNIPSLKPQALANELTARLPRGRRGPLWLDGKLSSNLESLIAALKKPRANLEVVANVLQPHVTKSLLANARTISQEQVHGDRSRLRRLDHLLLSTDAAVGRAGARLAVVTSDS
ncbi:hypothetical protein [Candidatus Poriferisodalis sp.]|uniref:hypothetical protein n=1 Tax=Candidatus Poriferisodalis sp. TaxID=3101277 RepID=UPI003B02AB76